MGSFQFAGVGHKGVDFSLDIDGHLERVVSVLGFDLEHEVVGVLAIAVIP